MRTNAHTRGVLIVAVLTAIEILVTFDSLTIEARTVADPMLDYERIVNDHRVMREFAEMFLLSESTPMQIEIAAFLVRELGGGYRLVRWPMSGTQRTETWRGPIPRGTIAVVHTHPNGWMKPSAADHHEASRIGIPFLVLTRTNIFVAEPERRHALPAVRGIGWSEESHLASLEPVEKQPRPRTLIAARPDQKPSTSAPSVAIRQTTGMR